MGSKATGSGKPLVTDRALVHLGLLRGFATFLELRGQLEVCAVSRAVRFKLRMLASRASDIVEGSVVLEGRVGPVLGGMAMGSGVLARLSQALVAGQLR